MGFDLKKLMGLGLGLGLEQIEVVLEGGLEGGEVGIEVGPSEIERGERRGVGLKIFEGFFEILFLDFDEFQSC